MKRVATHEHPAGIGIPPVVGMTIVRVQPEVVAIALDVEHVEIAVRIGFVQDAIRNTSLRILSGMNRICDCNHSAPYTKYLHFLKCSHAPPYPQP